MYSLINLEVNVVCVHLQRKSKGGSRLKYVETDIKQDKGKEQYWEKVASQRQKDLDKLMSEKDKDKS